MPSTILPRRGTASAWATANPILSMGERGFVTDANRWKTGDGVTHWSSLPYDDDIAKVTGLLTDASGADVVGRKLKVVLDENGEIDDILTEEI